MTEKKIIFTSGAEIKLTGNKNKVEYKSRNPERIDRIIETIRAIWKSQPDLRLCQLIGNCFDAGDLYYKEDSDLEKKLNYTYNHIFKEKQ